MPLATGLFPRELPRWPRRFIGGCLHYFLGAFFWFFFKGPCRGRIRGARHLDEAESGGFVLAANHSSYLDWVLLYIYFRLIRRTNVTFLAKSKVLDHPLWGPVVLQAECVRVLDRRGLELFTDGHKRLLDQERIVIFPEGTRSPSGRPLKPKSGVARLAASKNLPVIPAALCGFFEAWPRHRKFPRVHPMEIRFGPPLDLSGCDPKDKQEMGLQTARIMTTIERMKNDGFPYPEA
jgi:1-acyl-sn-glycerol-3-phosphate acyltransferase